ncbi:helix-turn-helix transcriptional regulator [Chelatococcus reniformis]|uniref:Transcriptional regulator n=1 Tax=Chelatococcus reniformis TaxID=1494448 RepID=A0A916URX1_9HYPH|nr:helix-turn-helix transcriptional regulator [Chelatococcus reniformis]GGC85403.1 transcriptional regulator [Chelatococcus reniformis]
MTSKWDLERIAAAFAEAALNANRWTFALQVAGEAVGARGAALLGLNGPLPQPFNSPSLHEATDAYIKEGWAERDERYRAGPLIARQGIATDLDFISPELMARNPYYQEFLARFDLRWFAGLRIASGGELWCLRINRGPAEGPFSHEQLAQLGALSSQLSSSAVVARALGFAQAEAVEQSFDTSGQAVALIGWQGEVIRTNRTAERYLAQGLVQLRQNRLTGTHRDDTAALDRALHGLVRGAHALASPVVLRRDGARPLIAHGARLACFSRNPFAACRAIVVLTDPEQRGRISAVHLRKLFRLTPSEARLAALLASGDSLETLAAQLGVRRETTRSLLKSVFLKTGTNRQAELVALLLRLGLPSE